MKTFWMFARDFRSLGAWLGKSAIAVPFLLYFVDILPPGSPRRFAVPLATLLQLIVLIYIFDVWSGIRTSGLAKRFRILVVLWCVLLVVYISLDLFFVYDPVRVGPHKADTEGGYVYGFILTEYGRTLKGSTNEAMLASVNYDPKVIWTENSIAMMTGAIFAAWLALFATLSATIAAFVLLRRAAGANSVRKVVSPGDIG